MNWRREGIFLAIASMETCWIVGWSRVILGRQELAIIGFSWWSVWALFVLALATARTLGRLELRAVPWAIGGLAFFTSLLLLQVNLGWSRLLLHRPNDPSAAAQILTLLLGLLVWFRALRTPGHAGSTRAIARLLQIGLVLLVSAVLATLGSSVQMTDLVCAYFGFGLLAAALTRIEEVAQTEPSGGAPFNRKWAITLAATLLAGGVIVLLVAQVITVESVRWLLRPLVNLLNIVLFVAVVLATELVSLLLPLFRWLLGDLSVERLREGIQEIRQLSVPTPEEEVTEIRFLSPQVQEALWVSAVALLILVVIWLLVRSFQRWRMGRYTTPGGMRETVEADGSLAQDLAGFLWDQWQRLRDAADLRRLFRRLGTDSAHAIYANFLALMAALDHPRQPEQTPYEYEPVAEEVLPARRAEIVAITEAYIRARYGEVEISADELTRLQEAWKRIQTEGEKLLKDLRYA